MRFVIKIPVSLQEVHVPNQDWKSHIQEHNEVCVMGTISVFFITKLSIGFGWNIYLKKQQLGLGNPKASLQIHCFLFLFS